MRSTWTWKYPPIHNDGHAIAVQLQVLVSPGQWLQHSWSLRNSEITPSRYTTLQWIMLLLIAQTHNRWWVKTSLQLQQQPLKVQCQHYSHVYIDLSRVSVACVGERLLVVGDFKEHRLRTAARLSRALAQRRLSFHLFLWYTKRALKKNMSTWQPPVLYCIMYNSLKAYCIKAQYFEYLQCNFVLFWSFRDVFCKATSKRRYASLH